MDSFHLSFPFWLKTVVASLVVENVNERFMRACGCASKTYHNFIIALNKYLRNVHRIIALFTTSMVMKRLSENCNAWTKALLHVD